MGGSQNLRNRTKNRDRKILITDRIHRLDKNKVDKTEDAVSHVTETGIGTATDPNPEMDASPLLQRGPHIKHI